jgi:hypothetical protein
MTRSAAIFLMALVGAPAAAYAASGSINLGVEVPLVCNINVLGSGSMVDDDTVSLGAVRELCNGAAGHQVQVIYDPGSLVGAKLSLGGDSVVLDGSGVAIVSDTGGAAFRTRSLALDAGVDGFDTNSLDLAIIYKG